MPVDTDRVVDDVPDGGLGTDGFASGVLYDDVVDLDSLSDWDGDDEVTAALDGGDATAALRKRKGRGKANHAAKHERKSQRRATSLLATQGNDEVTAALDGDDATAAVRKRKGRGKANHVAKDGRKRQRRATSPLATQGNTEAGT